MIYEENKKLYEKRYKTKYNPLLEEDDTIVLKDTSHSGQTIFGILFEERNWFFSSRYDSEVMAKGWTDLCDVENEFSTIFIFGFANGDYIKEISKKHPNNIIIVFEPSINLFDNNMKNIDLSFVLNNEKIVIAVGQEAFIALENKMLSLMDYGNYWMSKMLILPNYDRVFRLECLKWMKLIEVTKQNIYINGNTERWFESNIAENSIANIMDLLNQNIVSNLIKRFRCQEGILNRPAIIVSAGPSLDKNIKELKKAQDKALILCVDSAIITVIKAGIRPDIIITVDPNKPVRLFNVAGIVDIPLVCDIDYNHKILDVYNGKRIYSFSNKHFIYHYLKQQLPDLREHDNLLLAGGSVATTAFSLARDLGFKDIILIGQDLAYPDNKTHSKDRQTEDNVIIQEGNRYFEVEDVFGNKVLTETNMNIYREWFEDQIRFRKYLNVYDATEGGAKIKGAHIISLEEIIKQKCESLEDICFKDVIDNIDPLFSEEVSKQLLDKFLDTQNLLGEIRNRIKKIIRIYEKLNKLNISGKQGTKQFVKLLNELKEEQDKLENSYEIKLIEKFNMIEFNNIQLSMYKQQENEYENYKYLFQKGIEMMEIYLKSADDVENEVKKASHGKHKEFTSVNS